MKKHILTLVMIAVLGGSACDSLNQETLNPPLDETLAEAGQIDGENLRKGTALEHVLLAKVERNYRMMENAYPMLFVHLPKEEAEVQRQGSRTKTQFVEHMIKRSLNVFDKNIQSNGRFLSAASRQNHQRLTQREHEFEFDLTRFQDDEEAALDYLIKLPPIDGEASEEISFNFAKPGNNAAGAASSGKCKSVYCDSLPRIQSPQVEKVVEFLRKIDHINAEPSRTQAALADLEFNAGLDPVTVGLLLPAIQKVREAARAKSGAKADILIEALEARYGVNLKNQKGRFLRFGGVGTISQLIAEEYDDTGDLDWATIQLNRAKFELEMLMLWSRYWDTKTSATQPGR